MEEKEITSMAVNDRRRAAYLPAAVAFALIAAIPLSAAVVTVAPSDPHGWSTATNLPGSVATFQNAPAGNLAGPGAFWGSSVDDYQGQTWVGTSEVNGIDLVGKPIKHITELTYYTYTMAVWNRERSDGVVPDPINWPHDIVWTPPWSTFENQVRIYYGYESMPTGPDYGYPVDDPYSGDPYGNKLIRYWHYPKQPFEIVLMVQKSSTNTSRRTLIYRPWVPPNDWHLTSNPYNQWVKHNALTEGRWCIAQGGVIVGGVTYPYGYVGTWDQVKGALSSAVIAAPIMTSAGWDGNSNPPGDPAATATGKALNFFAGARVEQATALYGEASYAWWTDQYHFGGYLDNVTVEIVNKTDPQNPVTIIPKTTFDFEPLAAKPPVAINGRAARDPLATAARNSYRFTACGVVVDETFSTDDFEIDDGSGMPIKVLCPNHVALTGTYSGAFVVVVGDVSYDGSGQPVITAKPLNITVLNP